MPPAPDRELLTQSAARQLLERAGQIDSDSTSVDTLRAAAREAGISEAAFEAALVEMRGNVATQAEPAAPRRLKRLVATIVAAAMLLGVAVFVVIPGRAGPGPTDMADHEFIVKCLPMKVAQDIAQSQLLSPGNEVQISLGSRVLRVRATTEQLRVLQSEMARVANALATCDNTPAGR